ncbi:MAG TPA: hypothetical protein VKR52_07775 [Terracidiphilus sp.]|nr:hypothetical protein [Terracidiphilus sp.]
MSATQRIDSVLWTRERAALLALVCLMAGMAGGWLIRGLQIPADSANAAAVAAPEAPPSTQAQAKPDARTMADMQAAPLINQLKSDPNNAGVLTSVGNLYYDAQQYAIAVDYYGRALKVKPADTSVRTDEGTAFWYMGNADAAIAEFDQALSYAPNSANTLFNRGLVKWQGKHDAAGAIADWKKLLAANPNYEQRDKVNQMLAEVQSQSAMAQGMLAK